MTTSNRDYRSFSRLGMGLEEARAEEQKRKGIQKEVHNLTIESGTARRAYKDAMRKGDQRGAVDILERAKENGYSVTSSGSNKGALFDAGLQRWEKKKAELQAASGSAQAQGAPNAQGPGALESRMTFAQRDAQVAQQYQVDRLTKSLSSPSSVDYGAGVSFGEIKPFPSDVTPQQPAQPLAQPKPWDELTTASRKTDAAYSKTKELLAKIEANEAQSQRDLSVLRAGRQHDASAREADNALYKQQMDRYSRLRETSIMKDVGDIQGDLDAGAFYGLRSSTKTGNKDSEILWGDSKIGRLSGADLRSRLDSVSDQTETKVGSSGKLIEKTEGNLAKALEKGSMLERIFGMDSRIPQAMNDRITEFGQTPSVAAAGFDVAKDSAVSGFGSAMNFIGGIKLPFEKEISAVSKSKKKKK